jgi:hypothetical protein
MGPGPESITKSIKNPLWAPVPTVFPFIFLAGCDILEGVADLKKGV